MGVRSENYILIGANIGVEHYDDYKFCEEEYEKYSIYLDAKNEGDIVYLIDGYCDKYFIIGEIIKYDEYDFRMIEFELNSEEKYSESKERVKKHIKENFNIDVEPRLIVLTHKR